MEIQETLVKLGTTGMIDLPTFDCKPHIGKEVKISKVTEHEGNYGYYILIETDVVTKFGDKDVTATKILGLQEDVNGKIGWGEKTKLGIFLTKMKVAHYNELVGKSVIIQTKTNKNGVDFLDFN